MTRRRGPPEAPPRAVSRAPAPPPPAAGCGRSPVGYPFSPFVDSRCIRGSPVSGSRVQGSRGQSVRPPVALGTNSWVFARAWRRGLARRGPRPRVRTSATALRVPRATCRAIIVDVAAPTRLVRARVSCPIRPRTAVFPRSSWQVRKGPRMPATTRLHASRDCARRDAGRVTRGSASAWVIARVSGQERPNAAATSSRARSFRHAHPPRRRPPARLGSGGTPQASRDAEENARLDMRVLGQSSRPAARAAAPARGHAPKLCTGITRPRARGGSCEDDPRSRRLRRTRRLPRSSVSLAQASADGPSDKDFSRNAKTPPSVSSAR